MNLTLNLTMEGWIAKQLSRLTALC